MSKTERRKKGIVQTKHAEPGNLPSRTDPGIVNEVLNSPGLTLENKTQAFMGNRFRHDFSDVRIHTGTKAFEAAKSVQAKAFTVGQNLVFGDGQYLPESIAGQKLIARELTHTLQQGYQSSLVVQRHVIDDVQEKLSYDIFDWAITDAEALEVLALLDKIPQSILHRSREKYSSTWS